MFHEDLNRVMDARGYTPERLCAEMQSRGYHVSASAVRSWMTGTRRPGLENIAGIVAALQCDPSEFVYERAS